jgi:hypothetical protein
VDRLKFLREALPLVGKFSEIWLTIGKCIDPLHIKTIKWVNSCSIFNKLLELFSATRMQNLVCPREGQTGLARSQPHDRRTNLLLVRKVQENLNSMGKNHFHFILHRLVKKRNRYTEYCHSTGKYPLLPSAKLKSK